jgi:hypothetical protein
MLTMAAFGRYKLTDALPEQPAELVPSPDQGTGRTAPPTGKGKGKGKIRSRSARGKASAGGSAAAEQMREARASHEAKNAEGSARDRMVDIGRGNQQAGRQRAK